MKKILFLLITLFNFSFVFACECIYRNIPQSYYEADIVAEITVLNIYGNNTTERTYKADVKFEKFYKGHTDKITINVQGLIGDFEGSACDLELKKGTKYLIFLDNDNVLPISSCTPHYKLNDDNAYQSKINAVESLFSFLKNTPLKNNIFTYYFEEKSGKSSLSRLKKFSPKNNFAVYEVLLNDKKQIDKVNTISEFGDRDSKICELIKKNLKSNYSNYSGNKLMIVFFYIPEYLEIKYRDHITSELY